MEGGKGCRLLVHETGAYVVLLLFREEGWLGCRI